MVSNLYIDDAACGGEFRTTCRTIPAPVAQWIEHWFPKPCAQVRSLPGARMIEPRSVFLEPEAVMSLAQILGIMLDQMFEPGTRMAWTSEQVIELENRLVAPAEGEPILLGIDDAALLLQGMAFTEVMSEDLPWIDTVRWVTDFVTAELRQHWTEEEWQSYNTR